MPNKNSNTLKATIIYIIVALFSTFIILFTSYLILGQKINSAISLVDKISIDIENKKEIVTTLNENNKITNYPEYGTTYAKIIIPKIDVELPVYFGDTLEVLKKGVGHSSGSYFPGEGGSIVYMGHNSTKVFRRFSELEIGDIITVVTNYGEYKYKIFNMELIEETEFDKLPIQSEKEILMVYTCYPFNNIGYTKQRYVVYSELVK